MQNNAKIKPEDRPRPLIPDTFPNSIYTTKRKFFENLLNTSGLFIYTHMEKQLWTRKQVSEFFSVTPRTLKNWEATGKIKVQCYLGNKPRYTSEELSRIINKQSTSKQQ